MSAAARARRLDEGAEIIVLERGDHVSYANCGLPYYVGGEIKEESSLIVQSPESLRQSLNLDIRLRHEVIDIDAKAKTVRVRTQDGEEDLSYGALVMAPGAQAVRPDIPGLDSRRVTTLRTVKDALRLRDAAQEAHDETLEDSSSSKPEHRGTAVVLGAGFIGLEAAEALVQRGLDVSVVELGAHVLPPLEPELAAIVKDELGQMGVTVYDGVAATEVIPGETPDTVVLSDCRQLDAEIIVLSVGDRPATAVAERDGLDCNRGAIVIDEHGRTNLPDVWAGGDATQSCDCVTLAEHPVPLAGPASRAGRLIADDIINPGSARPVPKPIGTAVVRVGELTVALTGANRRELEQAGIGYHTLHLHPNQHAGYFPGAKRISLIIHFERQTGRILGVQGVGEEGVDKRIDVLATAIRGDLGIEDLIDLDLTYSPPYGSAKDGVNMAGMMGQDVLEGTTTQWQGEDIAEAMEQALILDVRTVPEYESGHLPGAMNVPHVQVRAHLDEIREAAAGRPLRVHCASGFRSYMAERILRQSGFDDVANLSGGILTLKMAMADGLAPQIELIEGN